MNGAIWKKCCSRCVSDKYNWRGATYMTNFILHPRLNSENYKITNSFASVDRWQAIVYEGNSGRVPVGDFDKVGYVMISMKDNTIIPVARSDEHHTGWDMMERFQRIIPIDNYYSFWSHGNNYVYDLNDIKSLIIVGRKFLSWGGKDCTVIGNSSLHGKLVTLSYLIKTRTMAAPAHQLAPLGQAILDGYKDVAAAVSNARGSELKSSRAKIYVAALTLYNFLLRNALNIDGLDITQLDNDHKTLQEFKKTDASLNEIEQLLFGFNSIKNKLHNHMRSVLTKIQKGGKLSYTEDKMIGVWGDLELAVDWLGRF